MNYTFGNLFLVCYMLYDLISVCPFLYVPFSTSFYGPYVA